MYIDDNTTLKQCKTIDGQILRKCQDDADIIKEGLKLIQKVAENKGMDVGECLLMIHKGFGWVWDEIPYGAINDVKNYIANNAHRRYKIIYPEYHNNFIEYCREFNFNIRNVDGIETPEGYNYTGQPDMNKFAQHKQELRDRLARKKLV